MIFNTINAGQKYEKINLVQKPANEKPAGINLPA